MFDLKAYLKVCRERVDTALNELLNEGHLNASCIISAMKYSLMAGGKRLRPVLCIAAAEAVGGKGQDVWRAACAIEMVHTYSLIHDDLPAMDNDDLRRGKPTCHIAFDEATAILAGDALLTLAFEVLSAIDLTKGNQAAQWLRVLNTISRAAGYRGMIEGQMKDIASENTLLSLEELETMHSLKTGALIEASIDCGALLGGGRSDQMNLLAIYAKNIGLAFQVADDILNVEGDPAVMGKAVGTDEDRHKNTYPSLMGIERSKEFAGELVNNALMALESFGDSAQPLAAIARYVIERKR